jgi:hypothetical protein
VGERTTWRQRGEPHPPGTHLRVIVIVVDFARCGGGIALRYGKEGGISMRSSHGDSRRLVVEGCMHNEEGDRRTREREEEAGVEGYGQGSEA